MTLTRLLPTLRRSIPDPLAPEHWPAGTRATTTDVIVGGMSMLRLADRDGTPLAHLVPGPAGIASVVAGPPRHHGVAIATVRAVSRAAGRLDVEVDAEFGPHRPVWAEARLIGRASSARVATVAARSASGAWREPAAFELPGDLAPGDLIALPIEAFPVAGRADCEAAMAPRRAQRSAGATSAANNSSPDRSYAASGA